MGDAIDKAGRAGIRAAEIFRTIVRTGSTRRAARELGITQAGVSQHLKVFEMTVGEQLFERGPRGLVPTARGIEIYGRVDRYFEILGQIENEISDAFRTKRKTLTITAPHVLSLYLLPEVVLALDRLEPSIEYHLKAQRYDEMTQSVLTGEADIGISRLPLDDRFFEWEIVSLSKSVCVVRPDHRLAPKNIITVDDIADESLIVLEREYTSKQGGFATFGKREVSLDCKIHSDSIGLDASFVANGMGIAIDNSFIASQYKMFDLKIIPFEPIVTYEYVVFWRRGSTELSRRSAVVETILEAIQCEQNSSKLADRRL